jgi:hypothetical protein
MNTLSSSDGRFHTASGLAAAALAAPPLLPHLFPGDDAGLVNDTTVSEKAIRQQLALLLQSPIFAPSERLARFLRFTIEYALCGKQDELKEYLIGSEVYDRKPPYHPNQDSIVRTEARRLRSKLKAYYEGVGKNDPIFIYFRLGRYVPVFRARIAPDLEQTAATNTSDGLQRSLTQRDLTNQQITQRESLYSGFIHEASRLYANSLVHRLEDLNDLVSLYARVSHIRLLASDSVVLAAQTVVKQIIRHYADPNLTVEEMRTAALSAKADPLVTFSFACREELKHIAHQGVLRRPAARGSDGDGVSDLAKSMKAKMIDFRDPAALKGQTDSELFTSLRMTRATWMAKTHVSSPGKPETS